MRPVHEVERWLTSEDVERLTFAPRTFNRYVKAYRRAGILRIVVPLRDLPQWIFLGTAYVGIIVSVWALRDYWTGPAYEFMGLIAKAILIATQ